MDFFGAQDDARRKTWRLIALFAAAVVCLVVLTNLLVAAVYTWTARPAPTGGVDFSGSLTTMPATAWLWISLAVVAVVTLASGFKYLQVSSGGRAIAESLGGALVTRAVATDLPTQRLLNVVEEIAIASGVPVPPVYLIEQPSINAFAAGFGTDDAVIGVNRGTLDYLDREELQGVIAHEFSHLVNGDSRINLRLIAVLHGILFIGLLGRGLLHGFGRTRYRSSRSSSNAGVQGLILGVGLLVIGYAGTFFGNLIKAAVSRQREYLADAASVQFTRNPGGIAGALKKIGALPAGSGMPGAAAAEASHMFFGQVGHLFLNRLMATHPPLAQRIRAVDPRWDGRFPALGAPAGDAASPAAAAPGAAALAGTAGGPAGGAAAAASSDSAADSALVIHASPDEIPAAVGELTQQSLDRAETLIDGLPLSLRDAAHDPFAARALMYAFVLDAMADELRAEPVEGLQQAAERGVAAETRRLLAYTGGLDELQKLTLVEMAAPALKQLSAGQYRTFVANLVTLIKADRRIDLLEWVLHRLLVKELKPHFEGRPRTPVRHRRVEAVADQAVELLCALAREGDAREGAGGGQSTGREGVRGVIDAEGALAAGLAALGLPPRPMTGEDPDFQRLSRALGDLRGLAPLQKPRLIKACATTVLADGRISTRQGTLLQGIGAALDCPLPPSIYRPGHAAAAVDPAPGAGR